MPIYMVVEGVKGTIETAETDTLVFKDSSTEASSRLFVGNLSFDQTSDSSFSPDGRQLVVTIKDGPAADDGQLDLLTSNISDSYGGTHVLYQDVFLPAVQHDYDLS